MDRVILRNNGNDDKARITSTIILPIIVAKKSVAKLPWWEIYRYKTADRLREGHIAIMENEMETT